jgi:hypothetical protein
VKACEAPRPRDRYKVGALAHLLPAPRRWLPVRVWDGLVARQTGLTLLSPTSVGQR